MGKSTMQCKNRNNTNSSDQAFLKFNSSAHQMTLWDPWGVFFIYLTYEIGISDYKGMNLGWMNLG